MPRQSYYRAKAEEVAALARSAADSMTRQTLEQAARAWLMLAALEACRPEASVHEDSPTPPEPRP